VRQYFRDIELETFNLLQFKYENSITDINPKALTYLMIEFHNKLKAICNFRKKTLLPTQQKENPQFLVHNTLTGAFDKLKVCFPALATHLQRMCKKK